MKNGIDCNKTPTKAIETPKPPVTINDFEHNLTVLDNVIFVLLSFNECKNLKINGIEGYDIPKYNKIFVGYATYDIPAKEPKVHTSSEYGPAKPVLIFAKFVTDLFFFDFFIFLPSYSDSFVFLIPKH